MKIIPLGTNGFFPSFGRQTACYVVPNGRKLIILDAGSGLFRFAEPEGKELLKDVSEIHLFLSHYHLDHTFGFYAAFQLFKNIKVKVFAQTGRQVFWEFVDLKHFPVEYSKVHRNFSWQKLEIGENKIGDYCVKVRKQIHRGEGSIAFRFKLDLGDFAYITDSEPRDEGVEFVNGVPLLLHEHDFGKGNYNGNHITTTGAASVAKKAKVDRLFLIHHSPYWDKNKLDNSLKTAKSIFPDSYIAQDLKEISWK